MGSFIKNSATRFLFVYHQNRNVILNPKKIWNTFDNDSNWFLTTNKASSKKISPNNNWILNIGAKKEPDDGIYCSINRNHNIISFQTDAISGIPIFWYAQNELIIVASDILLIIKIAKMFDVQLTPNLQSASEIIISSYIFSENQTLVNNINILQPRSILSMSLNNGSTNISSLPKFFQYSESNSMNWQDAIFQMRKNLVDGLKSYKDLRVASLLSGGADSRIIATSAHESGINPDFFTFGKNATNNSDFKIANLVASALGSKTNCITTSSENFLNNWKDIASYASWSSDSIWWAARLPKDFFNELATYDVILRGDGDGVYGWHGSAVSIEDIFHSIEIPFPAVYKKFQEFFFSNNPINTVSVSQKRLKNRYTDYSGNLRDLKNILYSEIREPRGIAPGIWYFSRNCYVDAPLIWKENLNIASNLPNKYREHKKIIFSILETFPQTNTIPFSDGPSWNDKLEHYSSGVWEELIEYSDRWSQWSINKSLFKETFLQPQDTSDQKLSLKSILSKLIPVSKSNYAVRKIGMSLFKQHAGTSMSERILTRTALISNLCETLQTNYKKNVESESCPSITID